jgi:catechol 2,3-dioxygenase-like lactoylglutathione lyase family enzyme
METIVTTRLEHANLEVRDFDAMVEFLLTAFADFRVRYEAVNDEGERWAHVGNDETYVAVNQATLEPAERWVPYAGKPGVNHLGYAVQDVEALRARLTQAGYRETTVPNAHPHRRRVYFNDREGNDWEFVEYRSADPVKRNDYAM